MRASASVPVLLPPLRSTKSSGAGRSGVSSAASLAPSNCSEKSWDRSIYSRMWAPEGRRLVHERRERRWLRSKGKHSYVDFSEKERAELRRYFEALADAEGKLHLDKLEDMLISLGLAETQKDVAAIVDMLDGDCSATGQMDFEEFLEIVRKRTASGKFPVFKSMMEGTLGDQNLNFQTVISSYRRGLIQEFLMERFHPDKDFGKTRAKAEKQERWRGEDVLTNFAKLQRSRYEAHLAALAAAGEDAAAGVGAGGGSSTGNAVASGGGAAGSGSGSGGGYGAGSTASGCTGVASGTVSGAGSTVGGAGNGEPSSVLLPFEEGGVVPTGGLEFVWRTVVAEHGLVSSRPSSAETRNKRREAPLSPRSVVNNCLKVKLQKQRTGRTIIIREAAVQDAARNAGGGSPPGSAGSAGR